MGLMGIILPRGGTSAQKNSMERSKIPTALCEHIVDICEGGMMTCELG